MHERTGSPSTRTVQAPQTPCSQLRFVPVSNTSSRRKSAKCLRGGTSPLTCRPFTSIVISVISKPLGVKGLAQAALNYSDAQAEIDLGFPRGKCTYTGRNGVSIDCTGPLFRHASGQIVQQLWRTVECAHRNASCPGC